MTQMRSGWRLAVGDWLLARSRERLAIGLWPLVQNAASAVLAKCQKPIANRLSPLRWLRQTDGDMVWSSIVLIAVLLPLAGLTLDVPRYYVLRSRLQLAADAAAEATAQCVDVAHFQHTGETRLNDRCRNTEPPFLFNSMMQPLLEKGYRPRLTAVEVDEVADSVTVRAAGDMRLFFAVTPPLTIEVTARSGYRMEMR